MVTTPLNVRSHMQLISKIFVVLAFTVAFAPTHASAQYLAPGGLVEVTGNRSLLFPDTMETARGMAMGLGARASAASTSALAYNAAALSLGNLYHAESSVIYEPQAGRFSTNASVIDSYSGPVNAGFSFRYIHGNGEQGHGGFDGRLSLGMPLGDHFAIGLSGRYLSLWEEGQPEGSAPLVENFTFDASIRITPVEGLHIALLGYNILDVGSPYAPIQTGGSISYTIDNTFTLAVDGLADLTSFRAADGSLNPQALIGGAAEYFTGEVPIRAGYVYDAGRDQHYVTAGLGWMNSQLGIDIAMRQQVTDEYHSWLLASFRYFVQ